MRILFVKETQFSQHQARLLCLKNILMRPYPLLLEKHIIEIIECTYKGLFSRQSAHCDSFNTANYAEGNNRMHIFSKYLELPPTS